MATPTTGPPGRRTTRLLLVTAALVVLLVIALATGINRGPSTIPTPTTTTPTNLPREPTTAATTTSTTTSTTVPTSTTIAGATTTTGTPAEVIRASSASGPVLWQSGDPVPTSDTTAAFEAFYCCKPPFPDGLDRSGSAGCSGQVHGNTTYGGYVINGRRC